MMTEFEIIAFILVVTVICLGTVGVVIYLMFPHPVNDADDPTNDDFARVPVEPDHVGTFTNIRLPVNLVVERAARSRHERPSPKPSSEAAE